MLAGSPLQALGKNLFLPLLAAAFLGMWPHHGHISTSSSRVQFPSASLVMTLGPPV